AGQAEQEGQGGAEGIPPVAQRENDFHRTRPTDGQVIRLSGEARLRSRMRGRPLPGYRGIRAALVASAALLGSTCMKNVSSEPVRPDDSVLYVADRVRTLSAEQPLAAALLIRWGKVAAVGSREKLQAANPGARIVELRGATIVPGLVDAHGHVVNLGRSLSILSFVGTSSVEEILRMARNASPASYEGEWLVGRGWDQTAWGKGGDFATRQQLDAIFPSTPVYFTRVDGHAIWVNRQALRKAEVGRAAPDPSGGRIIRDRGGEPTGVLVDNAMQLVGSKMPAPTDEQRERWLRTAVEKCVSLGLTSVHDAGTDLPTSILLRQWDSAG